MVKEMRKKLTMALFATLSLTTIILEGNAMQAMSRGDAVTKCNNEVNSRSFQQPLADRLAKEYDEKYTIYTNQASKDNYVSMLVYQKAMLRFSECMQELGHNPYGEK